jgi:alpha-beta hydrolase superfamily lysophospholipase
MNDPAPDDAPATPDPAPRRGAVHHLISWSKFLAWVTLTVAGRVASFAFFLVMGGILALLILGVVALDRRDDLSLWHTTVLEEEFTEDSDDVTFADYLAREDRLFEELEARIYDETGAVGPDVIHRYQKGSPADPTGYASNWNRTFQLVPEGGAPTCGVLLLHGMSDSPYSLRAIGERLRREGAHVIGLRLPGHGTAPSGLLEFTHRDMAAAVELAMRHLRGTLGDRPLYLVGYSNGGALSVHHALECLEDETLPKVDGILLISPAIGVTPMAAFAVWQGRIGHWLGLEKLAWNSISAEYDPYKYNSFAVNAGDQVYRLTADIARHLSRLDDEDRLAGFPPVLAFQSVVDATVSTPALIEGLFSKLPGENHELVLFDLNRTGLIESFLAQDPGEHLGELIRTSRKPFSLTVLRNRNEHETALEERHYPRTGATPEITDPGLAWPQGIYSLSHVALPFPPEDPLYGNGLAPGEEKAAFQIGNVVLRGEKGVIRITPVDQLRLRWNPFHPWLEDRIAGFVKSPGRQ